MRIAVLSDVHGFSLSLEIVLADIDSKGPWDDIVVAGDLAEGGPDPAGAIDIIRERGLTVVQGNTDRDVAADSRSGSGPRWTSHAIGPERLGWLGSLPFACRITPPETTPGRSDLLIVHANPLDMDRHLHPDASPQAVRELIGDTQAAAIAFGHLHISYIRKVIGYLLVDVSAAGNPKDGDIRSRWGSFEWREDKWNAELHYVQVDPDPVIAQFRDSGRPNVEKAIAKFLKASYAD